MPVNSGGVISQSVFSKVIQNIQLHSFKRIHSKELFYKKKLNIQCQSQYLKVWHLQHHHNTGVVFRIPTKL